MKKILITGINSYIGNSLEEYLLQQSNKYIVEKISLRDDSWKSIDFSIYDSIVHTVGIAHVDITKIDDKQKQLYFDINTYLTKEVAEKYKQDLDGATGQFIYLSSIIVYGEFKNKLKTRFIEESTPLTPSSFYGESKMLAENELELLGDSNFNVSILRLPMVYGENSKGNYQQLKKIAKYALIFPEIHNKRSMIEISNLNKYITEVIDSGNSGILFPQDNDYHTTARLVKEIREKSNKKTFLVPGFRPVFVMMSYIPGKLGSLVNKAFGSIVYSKKLK